MCNEYTRKHLLHHLEREEREGEREVERERERREVMEVSKGKSGQSL